VKVSKFKKTKGLPDGAGAEPTDMLCFTELVPDSQSSFLLQDIVDPDAQYCILHVICCEICRTVFVPLIVKDWLIHLQQHIAEHHTLLAEVDLNLFTH